MKTKNIKDVVAEKVEKLLEKLSYGGRKNLLDDTMGMDTARETLTTTLTQLVKEVEAGERVVSRELYEALEMMFEQYCPNGDHKFMTAGETAEELLEKYLHLKCDCGDSPNQQEQDGHTRYCEALNTPPTSDVIEK